MVIFLVVDYLKSKQEPKEEIFNGILPRNKHLI